MTHLKPWVRTAFQTSSNHTRASAGLGFNSLFVCGLRCKEIRGWCLHSWVKLCGHWVSSLIQMTARDSAATAQSRQTSRAVKSHSIWLYNIQQIALHLNQLHNWILWHRQILLCLSALFGDLKWLVDAGKKEKYCNPGRGTTNNLMSGYQISGNMK